MNTPEVSSGPTRVYFEVEGKLHRGYRDESGRFTLEQCNLSKANEAGNLLDLEASEANLTAVPDHCEWCFLR